MARKYKKSTQESLEMFVAAWQAADNVQEVADALGLKKQYIANTAVNLRKRGVPLKKMHGNWQQFDYDALSKLANKLGDE